MAASMLKLMVATIAWAGTAFADTCQDPDTSASTCVCDGQTYDFSQIKPTDDNPYFSAPDQDSEYMYYFQMTNGGLPSDQGAMPYCTFSQGKEQGNAVGQGEIEGDACFPIGEVAQQSWEIDNSDGQAQTITITFAGGEEGRQTIIVATCDPTADNPTFQVKGEIRSLVYELDITTKHACDGGTPSPSPPPPDPPSPPGPSPPPSPKPSKWRPCADIRQGTGSTPEDEASCESWSLCKQHRRIPTFVQGTGDEEDSCCCSEPSDDDEPKGDTNQFCCAIASAPEPNANLCSPNDVKTCSQGFATAATACASAVVDAKGCNIMAPQISPAFKDCTEIFDCMQKSFGKSFGKCCNCINAFAARFQESQFQLDCTAA